MEKRKERDVRRSAERSLRFVFLKTKLLCQNFLGEQNESECPRCFRKGSSGQTSGENERAGTADPKEKRRCARGREDRSAACGEDEKNKRKSGRRKRVEGRRKKEELGAAEQKSGSGRIICKQFDAK